MVRTARRREGKMELGILELYEQHRCTDESKTMINEPAKKKRQNKPKQQNVSHIACVYCGPLFSLWPLLDGGKRRVECRDCLLCYRLACLTNEEDISKYDFVRPSCTLYVVESRLRTQ